MPADAFPPALVPESTRTTLLLLHLSALTGLVSGVGFLLGPLAVWALKRAEHAEVDAAGKEVVNFQLTMLAAGLAACLLCITIVGLVVGIPLALAAGVLAFVCPVIAAVKTANGEPYRYPFTHPFIK